MEVIPKKESNVFNKAVSLSAKIDKSSSSKAKGLCEKWKNYLFSSINKIFESNIPHLGHLTWEVNTGILFSKKDVNTKIFIYSIVGRCGSTVHSFIKNKFHRASFPGIFWITTQKQPFRGRKRCSENMQQIYRRTPIKKWDFNKVEKKKIKFYIKDFYSKSDQIRNFLWLRSHLLKKSYGKRHFLWNEKERESIWYPEGPSFPSW